MQVPVHRCVSAAKHDVLHALGRLHLLQELHALEALPARAVFNGRKTGIGMPVHERSVGHVEHGGKERFDGCHGSLLLPGLSSGGSRMRPERRLRPVTIASVHRAAAYRHFSYLQK